MAAVSSLLLLLTTMAPPSWDDTSPSQGLRPCAPFVRWEGERGGCPPGEHYEACGEACVRSCLRYECPLSGCCVEGCFCDEGRVRGPDGRCVPEEECLRHTNRIDHGGECGPGEYISCESECERNCSNYHDVISCDRKCVLGCVCVPPRIRGPGGHCVLPHQCQEPQSDDRRADVLVCNYIRMMNPEDPRCLLTAMPCNDPFGCPSDVTEDDHLLQGELANRKDTPCFPEVGGARQCDGAHEHYEACGDPCPETCSEHECPVQCCVEGCFCDEGFVRDPALRTCVPREQCHLTSGSGPQRCRPGELLTCDSGCERTCDNYREANRKCPDECRLGCVCLPPRVRGPGGACVLPSECPATAETMLEEHMRMAAMICNFVRIMGNPPAWSESCPMIVHECMDSGDCSEENGPPLLQLASCPPDEYLDPCLGHCQRDCDNYLNTDLTCPKCVPGCVCSPPLIRGPECRCVHPHACPGVRSGQGPGGFLPVPEGCRLDALSDPRTCRTYNHWNEAAALSCRQRETVLTNASMLLPCGGNLFSGVQFVCCPGDEAPCPQILCRQGYYLDVTAVPCPKCSPCPAVKCDEEGCHLDTTQEPCPTCQCDEKPDDGGAILPVPNYCRYDALDDRQTCRTYDHWNEAAALSCRQREMLLTNVSMLLPCGGGRSSGVQFVCCPKDADRKTCVGEAEYGPCRDSVPSWYYDVSTRRCRRFLYGGCGGNENRYATERECMEYCEGCRPVDCPYNCRLNMTQRPCPTTCVCEPEPCPLVQCVEGCHLDTTQGPCPVCRCDEKPDDGGEILPVPNYCRYDALDDRQTCRTYNHWNEAAALSCRQREMLLANVSMLLPCGRGRASGVQFVCCPKDADRKTCVGEADYGPCRDSVPSWYYDVSTRRCRKFLYGGCGGNENRYATERECMEYCEGCQPVDCPYNCRLNTTQRPCPTTCVCEPEQERMRAPSMPSDCPENERYSDCGTYCPKNCSNFHSGPRPCPAVCVRGCFCEEPLVRGPRGKCVHPRECP